MTTPLSILDFLFILVYLSLVILLGILAARKETSEGFLIADRNLGAIANTATIVASKTGAGMLITFVALVYLYGISAMWFLVGASCGYIIFIFFALNLRKISSGKEFYTLSDYFFAKYGKATGYVSAAIVQVYMLLILLLQLIGGAKILEKISGFSFTYSLLIIGLTILIYMVLGGFRAMVKTDIAQLVVIILLVGFLGYAVSHGSIGPLFFDSFINVKTAPLKSVISFFVIGIIVPFASADLWQRVYAAKNVVTVRRSLIASVFLYPFIGFLLSIIGLAISAQLKEVDPDLVLIEGFTRLLPAGLLGLAVVALLAAIMSSADSYLFVNIAILLQDFYARIEPVEKANLVRLFRYALVFFLVMSLILSFYLRSMVTITFIALAFGTVIALAVMATWVLKRMTTQTLLGGMGAGFVGTLVMIFISPVTETLTLKAMIFTFIGFLSGSLLNWLSRKLPQIKEQISTLF